MECSAQPTHVRGAGKLFPVLATSTEGSVTLSLCLGIFPTKEENMLMIRCTGMAYEGKHCLSVVTWSHRMAWSTLEVHLKYKWRCTRIVPDPRGTLLLLPESTHTPQQGDWRANRWMQSQGPADGMSNGTQRREPMHGGGKGLTVWEGTLTSPCWWTTRCMGEEWNKERWGPCEPYSGTWAWCGSESRRKQPACSKERLRTV